MNEKKIFYTILTKYLHIINVWSKILAIKLLKYLNINNYTINLKKIEQLYYVLIYSYKFIKLENFKTFIRTN